MNFETLQRVLGEEAELDWVQFQSVVFVHGVLLRVDVECFLDSPLQTVTVAIDHLLSKVSVTNGNRNENDVSPCHFLSSLFCYG